MLYFFAPFRRKIEEAGASFVPCDRYMPPPPRDVDRQVGKDFAGLVEMVTHTTLAMEAAVGADLERFRPDCIVSDSMCFWGKLWAGGLGVPYVCSTTTFAFNRQTGALMCHTPAQLLRLLAGQGRIRRCIRALRERSYPVRNLLSLIQNDNDTDTIVYTSRQFQPLVDTFSQRYAFIGPSVPEMDHAEDVPGPRHLYISLGTVNNRNLPFYRACLEAFRSCELQVTMSVEKETDAAGLGSVPHNITILPRVDQMAVLARSDVFLSHCGINSVNKSLYLGVPLVLFPQQAEQELVARRTAELGTGLRLEHAAPDSIRRAVFQVLDCPAYKAGAQELARGFRAAGGFRRGADRILESAAGCRRDSGPPIRSERTPG